MFYVQVDGASQDGAGPVGRWVGDQCRSFQAAYERGQCGLGLQSSHRAAEAQVDAAAEAQVLVVLSVGIEVVGVVEAVRVAAA